MTQKVSPEYSYTRLGTTNATAVQIFSGWGVLHYIVVNLTTAATIGIIDGTAGNITNVGKLKSSIPEGTYRYDIVLGGGLRIVPSGHLGDVTVVWSQG